jgi:hypothetical protein
MPKKTVFENLNRQGPGSGNLGESLVKATIPQRQYHYQIHWKIT